MASTSNVKAANTSNRNNMNKSNGRRRALLVGINDYPGNQHDLPSCVDDARAMGTFYPTSTDSNVPSSSTAKRPRPGCGPPWASSLTMPAPMTGSFSSTRATAPLSRAAAPLKSASTSRTVRRWLTTTSSRHSRALPPAHRLSSSTRAFREA